MIPQESDSHGSRSEKSKLKIVVSGVITLAAIIFFGFQLAPLWESQDLSFVPGAVTIGVTVALSVMWLLHFVRQSRLTLEAVVGDQRLARSLWLKAFASSMLARYIPGKIWPAARRALDLEGFVARNQVIHAFLLEQLLWLATGIVFAAFAAAWWLTESVAAAAVGGAATLLLVSAVFIFHIDHKVFEAVYRLMNRLIPPLSGLLQSTPIHGRSKILIPGFLASNVGQGVIALPIWFELAGSTLTLADVFTIVAAYPASRVVGQIGLSPSGLAVREGAYVAFLTAINPQVAIIASVWCRIISLVAEAALFALTRPVSDASDS